MLDEHKQHSNLLAGLLDPVFIFQFEEEHQVFIEKKGRKSHGFSRKAGSDHTGDEDVDFAQQARNK